MKQYRRENKSEFYFLVLFLAVWSPTTINFLAVLLEKITGNEFLKLAFPSILTISLILLSVKYWSQKVRGTDFLIYFIVIGLCYLNYLFDRTNIDMQNLFLPMFITSFMVVFAGIAINMNKLKIPLYYISLINIFLASFYYLVFTQASSYAGSLQSMTDNATAHIGDISYQILPSVLYVIWFTFKDFSILNFRTVFNVFSSILGFVLISSFGTRGPLVCLIVYLICYIFFFTNNKTLLRILTLFIGAICYAFLEPLLLLMASLMQSLGMSTRIFTYALDGTFLSGEDSTDERVMLLNEAKTALESWDINTLFGNGFLGWSKCMSGYPHNFYYDVMTSFGYVFGSLFLMWLIWLFIKTIRSNAPNDWKCLILVVSMSGFVQLFMSGTFWGVPFFYLLIGLCLNINRKRYIVDINP